MLRMLPIDAKESGGTHVVPLVILIQHGNNNNLRVPIFTTALQHEYYAALILFGIAAEARSQRNPPKFLLK